MERRGSRHEPFIVRLALVLCGESAFALLTDALAGSPPALVTTLAFGGSLAVALELQAQRAMLKRP